MTGHTGKVVIIADDLTGANDTGLQFAKRGCRTLSFFDVREAANRDEGDVFVFNAETRSLDAKAAYDKITGLAGALKLDDMPFVYKKIDSTMRGHVGAEIDALLDSASFDFAAVSPAYPAIRRRTIGGYHLVGDMLLEETEMAGDPKYSLHESHLPALLSSQSKYSVGHIDLRVIKRGEAAVIKEVREHISRENRILVFDSFTQRHLDTVAQSLLSYGGKVLWTGSAGLAQSLSEHFARKRDKPLSADPHRRAKSGSCSGVLVIAGSVSAVTREQIAALAEREPFRIVAANPVCLLEEQRRHQEFSRVLDLLINALDAGCHPVLTTDVSGECRRSVEEWIRNSGKDALYAGNRIAEALGEMGALAVSKRAVQGLVLTGGDIAYRTCKSLQVKALRIVGEAEEGMPLSLLVGGSADRLPAVTKAGAFGSRHSLLHAVKCIDEYAKSGDELAMDSMDSIDG